ncbi:MAG TPA: AI-2E family transporter [Tepidisphaeraceae bacterium]|nr:AI-2E family transporter [Tepidisphaeraceae bacterium]
MTIEKWSGAVSLAVLAVIGTVFALYMGSELLVPIAFAAILSIALRPIVRAMKRFHIPAVVSSGIIVLGLIATICMGGWLLAGPAKAWMDQAPQQLDAVRGRFEKFRSPFQKFSVMAGQIEQGSQPSTRPEATTQPSTQPAAEVAPAPARGPEAPGAIANLFGITRKLFSAIIEVILLVYLLLASDNLFFRKLLKVIPRFSDKAKASDATDEIENIIFRYLSVLLLINTTLGMLTTLILWYFGFSAPWLWGLAALVLEFIPYLGAIAMVAMLTLTAAASITGVWHILAIPASYMVLSTLNNSVISPYAYGSRLRLNPVAVLIGILFWWTVWGIPGAFLAVPLIATTKILADRTEGWHTLGEFLGE